ncbi:MAG TPA: polyprenyl diphosphate synthase, partial [Phycisphaerae bacterium]|nr:polyprenyl diphosphate synthase [Phycisphaerae bacterium]
DALTLYSFSTENWKRPKAEVDALMNLYVEYLIKERQTVMENNVRLIQVGRREGLPEPVLRELDETQRVSRDNSGLRLCLAINYGSRLEIVDAVREIARRVESGQLRPDEITEATIDAHLYTAGMPDPDLLIRTAGEMRVSNFLLWQISYAELYVSNVLWPDFRPAHLNEAIRNYAARQRRFGAVLQDITPNPS